MRFEELIVSVGDEHISLRFHPQLTVVGPMSADERTELIETVLTGAAGERSDVVLSMVDVTGEARRRVDAEQLLEGDAPRAEPADDGRSVPPASAPRPVTLAQGREQLRRTIVTTAADLGLPPGRPEARDLAELEVARTAVQSLRAEPVVDPTAADPTLVKELAAVEDRLRAADEAGERTQHFRAASRLVDVEAELAVVIDLADEQAGDEQLLAVTAELADLNRRGAEAAAVAEQARAAVQAASVVLDHPAQASILLPVDQREDPLTADFAAAAADWQRAATRTRSLEIALQQHADTSMGNDLDRRIPLLAPLDQDELWAAHARVRDAERTFKALADAQETKTDIAPEVEAELDAAHIERIRAEASAAARWRPGIVASSLVAVLALAMAPSHVLASLALMLVTLGVVVALILLPRRAVAQAIAEERAQLARVGATSYLGLHLRRLDDPDDDQAQRLLTEVARERTRAMVAWKELVGHLEPSEADGIEAEIRGHALRFNATLRAERDASLRDDLAAAEAEAARARAALGHTVDQLQATLDGAHATVTEATAARQKLLEQLGLEEAGDVDDALARTRLLATQRQRRREQARPRADIEAERAELAARVAELARPGWDGPPPVPPTAEMVSLLCRRRDELRSRLGVDLVDSDERAQQLQTMERRVRELEQRVADDQTVPPRETMAKRLLARMARARSAGLGVGGPSGESLPVILDDPLLRVAVDRRCDLLDMLARVSERVQVIYVTEDPVVISWARHRAGEHDLLLLEPVAERA